MTEREVNPLDIINQLWPEADVSHITFDQNVEKEYDIRRQSHHDGTLLFSIELMRDALLPLVTQTSFYKPTAPADVEQRPMRYTVGMVKVHIEYGMVDVPAGRIQGQTETVTVPVRCEYSPPSTAGVKK